MLSGCLVKLWVDESKSEPCGCVTFVIEVTQLLGSFVEDHSIRFRLRLVPKKYQN